MRQVNEQLANVREQLLASSRPLFLFDDDPDGLAAFLLLYRLVRCGKGIPLKGRALDKDFVEHVNEFQPDLILILDKHSVSQDFFKKVHAPCIWLDHHKVQQPPSSVLYINPRRYDQNLNLPTSKLASLVNTEDEWIAVSGVVSDWELPDDELWSRCEQKYPNYLPRTITSAPEGIYDSDAGRIVRLFSFILKGKTSQVATAMKILAKIKHPRELLQKEHKEAQLIMKLLETREKEYIELLASVGVSNDPLLLFEYDENKTSYTTDLSNELLYLHPEKVILIARNSGGSYKCSLRAAKLRIDEILAEVLHSVNGQGGGHEHACGAVIPVDEWETFLELLRAKIT